LQDENKHDESGIYKKRDRHVEKIVPNENVPQALVALRAREGMGTLYKPLQVRSQFRLCGDASTFAARPAAPPSLVATGRLLQARVCTIIVCCALAASLLARSCRYKRRQRAASEDGFRGRRDHRFIKEDAGSECKVGNGSKTTISARIVYSRTRSIASTRSVRTDALRRSKGAMVL
jgi:hypothetical protein